MMQPDHGNLTGMGFLIDRTQARGQGIDVLLPPQILAMLLQTKILGRVQLDVTQLASAMDGVPVAARQQQGVVIKRAIVWCVNGLQIAAIGRQGQRVWGNCAGGHSTQENLALVKEELSMVCGAVELTAILGNQVCGRRVQIGACP